jgi:hypothetical protein
MYKIGIMPNLPKRRLGWYSDSIMPRVTLKQQGCLTESPKIGCLSYLLSQRRRIAILPTFKK